VDQPPKLCPLSFGFSIKQQAPNVIDPKKVDVRIQVGFPCLKERCIAYEEERKWCPVVSQFIK